MGAPGSKFIKSKAGSARGLRGGDAPPHPLRVRSGQRYWPRKASSARANRIPIQILTSRGGSGLRARREDRSGTIIYPKRERLLARDPDGAGRHYVLVGWRPGAYRTPLHVLHIADKGWATVCVPEWHPGKPAKLPARLLPETHRQPGAVLVATCDLSANGAASLNIRIVRPAKPADLDGVHPPDDELVQRFTPGEQPERRASGQGCGDVVVIADDQHIRIADGRDDQAIGLFFNGPAPALDAGATVYLADRERVHSATTLRTVRLAPTGFWLVTETPALRAVSADIRLPDPGRWWRQSWIWRWWTLDDEAGQAIISAPDLEPSGSFPYAIGGQDRLIAEGTNGANAARGRPLAEIAGQPRARSQRAEDGDQARRMTGRRVPKR